MIEILTDILIVTAFMAALVFVVRLGFTRWYTRRAGIITMSFLFTVFSVLALVVVSTFFGRDWPGRTFVRLGIYGSVNILLWSSVYLLWRDQRDGRRATIETEEAHTHDVD